MPSAWRFSHSRTLDLFSNLLIFYLLYGIRKSPQKSRCSYHGDLSHGVTPVAHERRYPALCTDTGAGCAPGINIAKTIKHAEECWNPWWFRSQVENKGPWDFKQRGRDYQDFGNFHFGAVGAAFGFPESVLLNEAGRAQKRDKNTDPKWGNPGPTLLPWLGTGSYGDDPKDQYWIKQGIDFYKNRANWHDVINVGPP